MLRLLSTTFRNLLLAAVLAAIMLPSVIVLVLSFSSAEFLRFPPPSWGLNQYSAFFESAKWIDAVLASLQLGAAVGVAAVIVGVLFIIGVHRTRLPRIPGLEMLMLGPIIVPIVAYAVAMYGLYADLGLIGRWTGIFFAHTVHALPFAVLVLGAAISRLPRELEYASMSLGANRWRAYRDVTLRLLVPGLAVAGVLAFVTSFDEVVFVSFLAGPGITTLPLEIFNSLLLGVDPLISAISALLMAATAATLIFALAVRR